jgi:hypothetical protein
MTYRKTGVDAASPERRFGLLPRFAGIPFRPRVNEGVSREEF